MTEHGVEEFLRQHLAVGLAAQAIDHERCMQGECIEAPVKRIGNAAGLEQLRRARLAGGACIDGRGEFGERILAAEQALLPCAAHVG